MKPNPLLIPPGALLRLSQLLTDAGQGKHADEKWRTLTVDDHLQACLRHLLAHASGETVDRDYGQTHLVHALARLVFAVELQGAPVGKLETAEAVEQLHQDNGHSFYAPRNATRPSDELEPCIVCRTAWCYRRNWDCKPVEDSIKINCEHEYVRCGCRFVCSSRVCSKCDRFDISKGHISILCKKYYGR